MTANSLQLPGRVAVVTGATRGVGLAVAAKLRRAGCHVHLNYAHDDEAAARAAAALADGPATGSARLLKADVTDPAVWPGCLDGLGGLDIYVHNVASWHRTDPLEADLDGVHRDIATAVDPLLRAAPVLVKAMDGRGGRIVAISSTGGRAVLPGYLGAGLAKAALENLVRYLAVEAAPYGITVNAVTTAKIDKGFAGDPAVRALAARTPGGRCTTPADVADAVALLCTPEAHWIHGRTLTADGGLGLRA